MSGSMRDAQRSQSATVALALLQESTLLRPGEDPLTGLLLRQPGEVTRLLVHPPVCPDDHGLGQLVAPADVEVERVVARRHLQGTCPEPGIDRLIGDHGHAPLDVGNDYLAPDGLAIALVVRVDGNRHVPRDRGRPSRRDRYSALALGKRVRDVRERVVDVHVDELEIRERRLVEGAPVDDPVVAVDPPLLVEVDEEAHDRAHVVVIHREALAPVVERRADPPELGHDRPSVQAEPLPDALLEGLAPEVVPRLALAREVLLDRVLRGDTSVVVARLEERVEALHPLHAHERVGKRELKGVAHVQLPGDVRRRVGDHERRLAAVGVCLVETLGLPRLLPALFDAFRLVQRLHAVILGRAPERLADGRDQLCVVERLAEESVHARVPRAVALGRRVSCADDDDRDSFERGNRLQALHDHVAVAGRKHEVEEDQVGVLLAGLVDGRDGVARENRLESVRLQPIPEQLADVLVVVDDENPGRHRRIGQSL
jgi:hypothetical protein